MHANWPHAFVIVYVYEHCLSLNCILVHNIHTQAKQNILSPIYTGLAAIWISLICENAAIIALIFLFLEVDKAVACYNAEWAKQY